MRRTVFLLFVILTGTSWLLAGLLLASPLLASTDPPKTRKVSLGEVALSPPPARDLVAPEGKTRWDLSGVSRRAAWTRSLEARGSTVLLVEDRPGPEKATAGRSTYSDPVGGEAALQWWFPDQDPVQMRMGSGRSLTVDETKGDETGRLRIRIDVVGIGWIHLPSGPREVVLQRLFLQRDRAGSRWDPPDQAGYRWVDPRAGIVAEILGPAAPGTGALLAPGSANVLEAVLDGAADLKIHVSELYSGPLHDITYGWDRGSGTTVSSLTPQAYSTMGDLIASGTWDFSTNTSGTEVAATTTPVNSSETCNYLQCGYTVPGGELERTDKSFNVPEDLVKINDVAEKIDGPSDVTIWLRAGAQNEGVEGSFGSGESRFCYVTFGGVTRTPVPLWRFSHLDAGSTDYYFIPGDVWEGGPFNCEQNIFNQVCGASQFADLIWSKGCTGTTGVHTGKQTITVVKAGVVTVPSGHTFNALLVRNVADFCVYTNPFNPGCTSNCCRDTFPANKVDEVRTVNYLWQVPHLGTVARLQSEQVAPADLVSFSTLAETDIHFGLFPPRSITVTETAASSVSLSWDPGADTHRISNYKVYWDTDPGAVSPYAFNSVGNPGQVSIAGTSATVSGLAPGVTYYFTVTSRSVFTDPSSGVVTTYESLLYPTQVSGDPSFIYPVEVQATTLCPATAEVTGVTVNPTGVPGEIQICWSPVTDPCLSGYLVLGADSPVSDAGFSTLADLGLTTCWTGSPAQWYFLVIAKGTDGNGPWGHYGH